jgi:hypothetical protein
MAETLNQMQKVFVKTSTQISIKIISDGTGGRASLRIDDKCRIEVLNPYHRTAVTQE